jgi:hypothetical protein
LVALARGRGQRVDAGDDDARAIAASAHEQRVVAGGQRFAVADFGARASANVWHTLVTSAGEWQAARTCDGGRHVCIGSSVS